MSSPSRTIVLSLGLGIALIVGMAGEQLLTGQSAGANVTIIDDGDAGFAAENATWRRLSSSAFFRGDLLYAYYAASTSATTTPRAHWTFSVTPGKQYKVMMTYYGSYSFSRDALATVFDGDTQIASVPVDQSRRPADIDFDGKKWKSLGEFTVNNSTLKVTLSAPSSPQAQGFVVADGVRIVSVGGSDSPPPPPPPPPPPDTPPPPPYCGDGIVTGEETCDDRNRKPGDGCSPLCRREHCRDGVVTPSLGEECDDGNENANDGCTGDCRYEYCGDRVIQAGEQCDDGNVQPGDGCSDLCTLVQAAAGADLSTTIAAGPAVAGEPLELTLTITNAGPSEAKGSMVQFGFLTNYFRFLPDQSDAKCTFLTNMVRCDHIDVQAGQSVSARVVLDTTGIPCTLVTRFVSSTWSPAPDPNTDNNLSPTREVRFNCGSADIAVAASAPSTVLQGQPIPYSITITNKGPSRVDNAGLWFSMPSGMTLGAGSDAACAQAEQGIQCGVFSLENGESKSLTVNVAGTANMECDSTLHHVISGASPAPDPTPSNNASSPISITISCPPSTGNLFITQDPTPLLSRQLLGGTLGEPVLRLNLRAANEDIEMQMLALVTGSDAASVDRFELTRAGSTTVVGTAVKASCAPGGGNNVFCATFPPQQLVIPKNQQTTLIVRPLMKTDDLGAISGETFHVELLDLIGADDVLARGVQTMNALTAGEIFIGRNTAGPDLPIVGRTNVTVLAKIQSIINANPDPSPTPLPTGPASVGQFTVAAFGHGNTRNGLNKVRLQDVLFNVELQNAQVSASSLHFFNNADPGVRHACRALSMAGSPLTGNISTSFLAECTNLQTSAVDVSVDASGSQTFSLEMDIINPRVSMNAPSILQVSLSNASFPPGETFETFFGPTGSHLRWADVDALTALPFLWMEGHPDAFIGSTAYKTEN